MSDWDKISREDVIKAIEQFKKEKTNYANSSTTYLIYDNIVYPGKQIRRMAYYITFGIEPEHFYGGKNTIDFYENLGFKTYWTKRDKTIPEYESQILEMKDKTIKKSDNNCLNTISTSGTMLKTSNSEQKIKIPSHNMKQQKKCIQNLLSDLFLKVETEKKYDWAKLQEKRKYMRTLSQI